jgi:hypothetical protein
MNKNYCDICGEEKCFADLTVAQFYLSNNSDKKDRWEFCDHCLEKALCALEDLVK